MSEQKKENTSKQRKLNIELDEVTAQGQYSNLAVVNHSPSEFVIDFVNIMPGAPKSKVKSRIILTPQHAKRLVRALNDNIGRFEEQYGEIKDYGQKSSPSYPIGFGPTGEA